MKSKVDKAAKGEKAAKAGKSAKAGVEESKRPKGKGGGKGGEGKAVKSAKGKRAKSGKDANPSTPPSKNPSAGPTKNPTAGVVPSSQPSSVPSTQSPCPNSVVVNDNNAKDWFNVRQNTDYSSKKEVWKCFDTSQVTNMDDLLHEPETDFNADISSWDVSSVTT